LLGYALKSGIQQLKKMQPLKSISTPKTGIFSRGNLNKDLLLPLFQDGVPGGAEIRYLAIEIPQKILA